MSKVCKANQKVPQIKNGPEIAVLRYERGAPNQLRPRETQIFDPVDDQQKTPSRRQSESFLPVADIERL